MALKDTGRGYLTIGIGNVFASALIENRDSTEWVCTIKASPTDFVVREVSTQGLLADLSLTSKDIPIISETMTSSRKKRKAEKISTNISDGISLPELDAMQHLVCLLKTVDGVDMNFVLPKLSALDQSAKCGDVSDANTISIKCLDDKGLRTKLHLALAMAFPLLDSQTSGGNAIEVSIDRRFEELKEYLQYPVEDLSQLLGLYRHTIPNHESVRLRLKEGLPRADRRPVHRIIDEKSNHMLRTRTEDNAVEVKWAERKSETMVRTLGVIKKTGCEHSAMMKTLTKKLRCGQNDLSVAGIKDMLAETYQFCVVSGKNQPKAVHIRNIDFIPLGPASKKLERGELRGNRFELVIRNLQQRSGGKLTEQIVLDRFRSISQFVNYFGEQRVGEPGESAVVGVRAQDIGKAMLQRNYAKAIDLIMTGRKVVQGRAIELEEFRRVWKDSRGDVTATSAVKNIPSKERTILTALKRYNDPLAALRSIPFFGRMLYINAAVVWNHAVTQRLSLYGCKVMIGDLVVENYSLPGQVRVVESGEEGLFQITQVVLPLPGSDVVYPQNDVSQVYKRILSDDSVIFIKDGEPECFAKGAYRFVVTSVQRPVQCHKVDGSDCDFHLNFELGAGSYATMFLREILRTTATDCPQ